MADRSKEDDADGSSVAAMAAMAAETEDGSGGGGSSTVPPELITIVVKSPKDKKDIRIARTSNVKQLKDIITKEFNADLEQLCLIYAGKILKDTDHLANYGIKEGTTVHLVIKSLNKAQDSVPGCQQGSGDSRPPVNVGATPFGLGNIGGLMGLGNLGFGSANFMDLQQRMQTEMFSNPNLLNSLLENPMVQSLMSNPGLMQSLLSANPQMRELMQGNPEIARVLESPEMLQQASQVARNPAMLQELMRNTVSTFNTTPKTSQNAVHSPESITAATSVVGATGDQKEALVPSGDGSQSSTSGSGVTTEGVQSVVQQMMENPQMMSNIMQAPYMQSIFQNLASNPEIVNQFVGDRPLVPGNAETQETVRSALPYLTQQLANPEVQSLMGNPRALRAMLDVQEGMAQLQNEAPGILGGVSGNLEPQSVPPRSDVSRPQPTGDDQYSLLLRQMFGVMSNSTNPTTDSPEHKYEYQLNQLQLMGFQNRQANVAALTAMSGDLNAAVDQLLQQAQLQQQ